MSCHFALACHISPTSDHSRRRYEVLLSRWQLRRRKKIPYGFVCSDATFVKWPKSTVYKPNIVDIYQSTATWGLEKQTSAMLEFHFRIRRQPHHRFRHFTTHRSSLPNFMQIRSSSAELSQYRFSRWRPLWRSFTSGFGLGDVTLFKRPKSIGKPKLMSLNARLRYYYLRFVTRNRHVTLYQLAKCHSIGPSAAQQWRHTDFKYGRRRGSILLPVLDLPRFFLPCSRPYTDLANHCLNIMLVSSYCSGLGVYHLLPRVRLNSLERLRSCGHPYTLPQINFKQHKLSLPTLCLWKRI